MYRRILAIGDIHGEWKKFLSLYRQIQFDPQQDLLIFLGDYIDRGLLSLEALDWMYTHHKEKNIIMLRGNHEQMMLDYFASGCRDTLWLKNGGDVTAHALAKPDKEKQAAYLKFVAGLPLTFRFSAQGKDFFCCHAGVNPARSLDEQDPEDLLWIREKFFDHYQGKTIIVAGHTHVGYVYWGNTTPIINENMILLDTGSYMPGGSISCVDLLSGQFWQSA